ncbi:unnamed protein product, partial [Candidula unifasciata]
FKDTDGNTPLMISLQNGFNHIVEFLFTNKADVNAINSVGDSALILSIGFTPLMIVLKNRDTSDNSVREIVQVLLENGASVNDTSKHGETPLMFAAKKENNMKIVQILLENGTSVNDTNEYGETPLMLAAKKEESMSVLQLLLDHGAKLDDMDKKGNTHSLLHVALSNGHIECAKLLVQHGANIDCNHALELA